MEKTPGRSEKPVRHAHTSLANQNVGSTARFYYELSGVSMGSLVVVFKLSNTTLGNKLHLKSEHAMRKSQETRTILFKGQNMPDVMILAFRRRGMYGFTSRKRCALSNFKDRK